MKNGEKNYRHFTEKFMWIGLFLIFAVSCQKNEVFMGSDIDAEATVLLNITEVEPGTYTGEYSGGLWQISLPDPLIWNGLPGRYLLFYAHGMVDPVPYEPVSLPSDQVEGIPVKDIITGKGMGYAATSYRDNGLVVLEAVDDIKKLTDVARQFFREKQEYLPPDFLFLGGASEGGIVTVKTIEKYPMLFDGAISICGPIGNFYQQLQYLGDFHVLFNFFFGIPLLEEGIDLGDPTGVDPRIMAAWKMPPVPFEVIGETLLINQLQMKILSVILTSPETLPLLLKYAGVTVDMNDQVAMIKAVFELLRFNIMLTNDVIERMKGVPYNNTETWYTLGIPGFEETDNWVNLGVQRIYDRSYNRASNFVRRYETSGKLISVPLVTIHTTGDHIIPFWHQGEYPDKIFPSRNSLIHYSIDVNRYGHSTIDISHIEEALRFLQAHTLMQAGN